MSRRLSVLPAVPLPAVSLVGVFFLGAALPLFAQDEQALKRFFEGRRVVVRIDMPATSDGVDVYPEREQPLDWSKLGSRIRSTGVAVREGDRLTVTKVKVKDDLIEFQLGGGGFNTFHDSSSSVSFPRAPRTSREKQLEREVREETDAHQKRRLQRELDELRRDREREDSRSRAVEEVANAERRERDRERALDMGSRFNVRYEDRVPVGVLTPEGLMRVLSSYLEFPGTGFQSPERAEDLRYDRREDRDEPADAGPLDELVRKGMSRSEVEDALGAADREDESREGTLVLKVTSYPARTEQGRGDLRGRRRRPRVAAGGALEGRSVRSAPKWTSGTVPSLARARQVATREECVSCPA
jgi:hypothetical protein